MPIRLDESRRPLVTVEMSGRFSADDIDAFIDGGNRWLGARRPYGIVFVPQSMAAPVISELKPLFHWMDEHQAELAQYYRAMAVVTESAVLRGVLRGVLAIKTITANQLVTSNVDDAIAWALAVLAGHDQAAAG